ncbi:unnamed protein product [Rotaria sp. Silwood2]|nr:unnamed protein product [Rotaria sp. Silwood2]CAF3916943.1 unnamed protein product [Rotaria sp. Silwood2]
MDFTQSYQLTIPQTDLQTYLYHLQSIRIIFHLHQIFDILIYNHISHATDGATSDFYHSSNYLSNVCHTDETSTVGSHDSVNGFDLNNDDQVIHLVPSFVNKICVESGVNTI